MSELAVHQAQWDKEMGHAAQAVSDAKRRAAELEEVRAGAGEWRVRQQWGSWRGWGRSRGVRQGG